MHDSRVIRHPVQIIFRHQFAISKIFPGKHISYGKDNSQKKKFASKWKCVYEIADVDSASKRHREDRQTSIYSRRFIRFLLFSLIAVATVEDDAR